MAITFMVKSSPQVGFCARLSARGRENACVYDPPVIASSTSTRHQNRRTEQPPHERTVWHCSVLASFTEGTRDSSWDVRPFETKEFWRDRDSRREFPTRLQHRSSSLKPGRTVALAHCCVLSTINVQLFIIAGSGMFGAHD
jgi:hypothetical protein